MTIGERDTRFCCSLIKRGHVGNAPLSQNHLGDIIFYGVAVNERFKQMAYKLYTERFSVNVIQR